MRLVHYITLATMLAAIAASCIAGTIGTGEKRMHAKGPFDVKIAPLEGYNKELGRMSLDKQFHGDLDAVSKGEMLSQFDKEKQSGGYVAIERVTGTLGGKKGSFTLQHASTMTRAQPHQNIVVVPDSGTQQLVGLKGSLVVNIAADGAHSYDFEYEFDENN
jgi:Protein of unknown function (DUF3224)